MSREERGGERAVADEIRVHIGDETLAGRAIDLRGRAEATPDALVAAVRIPWSTSPARTDGSPFPIRVACPLSRPLHEDVGHVGPDTRVPLRRALARAARSRGCEAPADGALRRARARLDDLDVETVDLRTARRRVAETGADVERLREDIAALRGRVQALRERDPEAAAESRRRLRDTARRLSESETEHVAAVERLDQRSRAARAARTRREERLALEDRVGNLTRAVRGSLASAVYRRFADAVRRLPGECDPGDAPGEYEGDPVTAALGVVAVGEFDAPVVLSVSRFESPAAAAAALDAPVIAVTPPGELTA